MKRLSCPSVTACLQMPETAHCDLLEMKVHELIHYLHRLVKFLSEFTAEAGLKCQMQVFRHMEANSTHARPFDVTVGLP